MRNVLRILCVFCVLCFALSLNAKAYSEEGFFKRIWRRAVSGLEEPTPDRPAVEQEKPLEEEREIQIYREEAAEEEETEMLEEEIEKLEEELDELEAELDEFGRPRTARTVTRAQMLEMINKYLDAYGDDLIVRVGGIVKKTDAAGRTGYLYRRTSGEEIEFESMDDEALASIFAEVRTQAVLIRQEKLMLQLQRLRQLETLRPPEIPRVPEHTRVPGVVQPPARPPQPPTLPVIPKLPGAAATTPPGAPSVPPQPQTIYTPPSSPPPAPSQRTK